MWCEGRRCHIDMTLQSFFAESVPVPSHPRARKEKGLTPEDVHVAIQAQKQ